MTPTSSLLGSHLLLPLPRPQYVSVPEALITAIAWRVYDVQLDPAPDGKTVALVYRGDKEATKTLYYRSTEPEGDHLRSFSDALGSHGLSTAGDPHTLARAAAVSILGTRPVKGGFQPASPITPALALLQNMQGMQGSRQPPAVDKIVEVLLGLGQAPGEQGGAAEMWLEAVKRRIQLDPLSRALDASVSETLLDATPQLRELTPETAALPWQGLLIDTPFSWFARTWSQLTHESWVQALPARVWVDWASTVLRMALGMGFLWESAWYETIAREVLGSKAVDFESIKGSIPQTLPWKPDTSEVSVRDVAGVLGWRVRRSDRIRKVIEAWLDDSGARSTPLPYVLNRMVADDAFLAHLEEAISSRQRAGTNLWEAVRYALMVRPEAGPFTDHYGLLRARGRYLVIDPGTEWVTVMASLSCPGPGTQTDVARLMASLAELGLRPELSDLIRLLERAGLARGSADADQGVVVQSAF